MHFHTQKTSKLQYSDLRGFPIFQRWQGSLHQAPIRSWSEATRCHCRAGSEPDHKSTLIILDPYDGQKPYAKKMEHFSNARNGSKGQVRDKSRTLLKQNFPLCKSLYLDFNLQLEANSFCTIIFRQLFSWDFVRTEISWRDENWSKVSSRFSTADQSSVFQFQIFIEALEKLMSSRDSQASFGTTNFYEQNCYKQMFVQ